MIFVYYRRRSCKVKPMSIPRDGLALCLVLASGAVAHAQDEAAGARAARVVEARRQAAELLGRGEVEGRFVERVAGSYVLAPTAVGLPQLPILNPEAVSGLAVGPLV